MILFSCCHKYSKVGLECVCFVLVFFCLVLGLFCLGFFFLVIRKSCALNNMSDMECGIKKSEPYQNVRRTQCLKPDEVYN